MVRPARFLFVLALFLASFPSVLRSNAATLYLEPSDTTVTVGSTFQLRVMCDGVPDLKGVQSAYGFPAARLQLLDMPAGNVLTDAGGSWFAQLLDNVAAPTDTAWFDAAMLDGNTHGPGVVAYIQFKALLEGPAQLECVQADIRDSNNASLGPTCGAALVRVAGPVPVERRSWGRLKLRHH